MRVFNKHCARIAGIDPGRSGEISAADYKRDPWAFVIERADAPAPAPEPARNDTQKGSESSDGSKPAQANEAGSGAIGAHRRAHRQSPAPSSAE